MPRYEDNRNRDEVIRNKDPWRRVDQEKVDRNFSNNETTEYSGYYGDANAYRDPDAPSRSQGPVTRSEYEYLRRDSFYGKGPKGWKREDSNIKEEVCERLYRSYDVDASEIAVEVSAGIVYLRGVVEDRPSKREAERCAEKTPGVVDVLNELRIGRLS